jgi:hypothetical protein
VRRILRLGFETPSGSRGGQGRRDSDGFAGLGNHIARASAFLSSWRTARGNLYVVALVLIIPVGRLLVTGQDIYPAGTPYGYPAFSAILMVPCVFVPLKVVQAVWFVLSGVALGVVIKSAWELSGGGRVDAFDPALHPYHWTLWLGCLCALRFSFNAIQHFSLDLALAVLLLGGLAAIRNRFSWTAICWGHLRCGPQPRTRHYHKMSRPINISSHKL